MFSCPRCAYTSQGRCRVLRHLQGMNPCGTRPVQVNTLFKGASKSFPCKNQHCPDSFGSSSNRCGHMKVCKFDPNHRSYRYTMCRAVWIPKCELGNECLDMLTPDILSPIYMQRDYLALFKLVYFNPKYPMNFIFHLDTQHSIYYHDNSTWKQYPLRSYMTKIMESICPRVLAFFAEEERSRELDREFLNASNGMTVIKSLVDFVHLK